MADKPINILLIEDSLTATMHVKKMLAEAESDQFDTELECANRLSAGQELITQGGIDVILLDLSLPDSDGVDTFSQVLSQAPEVPVVVMSSLEDETLATTAVQQGAQYFLLKGQVNSNLLKLCILYSIERKHAERGLQKAHDELEKRVQERTAELAITNENLQTELTERKRIEEELKKAVAELERSNTELEQFAYVASHDLQEPLRMVASYTQLLQKRYRDKLDADADDFITYAVDGAKRMQNLINSLLSYSRVGTRGKPFEPTESESVFEQALANLKLTIDESGADVTHDPLPRVKADETQLIQLFQNLLSNAVKFHGEEQPRIHVSAKQNSNEYIFSVSDNGIGIDPKHFDRIFVIFQRLHGREEYSGIGIGLPVCKRIVERHGGRIWLESQPGEGCTFYFTMLKGDEGN